MAQVYADAGIKVDVHVNEKPASAQITVYAEGATVQVIEGAPPVALIQYQLFDGPSGVLRGMWNQKIPVPWKSLGGDWLDANQMSQGAVAFGTFDAAPKNLGAKTVSVTPLVARWLAGANRGLVLASVGPSAWGVVIAGRLFADSTKRPTLTVVTSAGTFICACSASVRCNKTSSSWKDGRTQTLTSTADDKAMLQFDLAAVTGTLTSATLNLYVTSMGGSQTATVKVFELDPPVIQLGGGGGTPVMGVADAYPNDVGLSAHPSILMATDFTSAESIVRGPTWDTFYPGLPAAWSRAPDTDGSTYFRSGFLPADYGGGMALRFAETANPGCTSTVENKPVTNCQELYFRYYLYFEADWGDTSDNYKMPGIHGQFGQWISRPGSRVGGDWGTKGGNGGDECTGKYTQMGANRCFVGWSMRGKGRKKYGDGNPYDDLFAVGNYCYWIGQTEPPTGSDFMWGPVLEREKWYCIEQRCKMNTIAGPFDALGNGTANADGIYQAWIDGVLVNNKTDWKWSNHPDFGIQGAWLDWYHGGIGPDAMPTHPQHYRMNHVAIGSEYIGPIKR